jgi:hypothetical protein
MLNLRDFLGLGFIIIGTFLQILNVDTLILINIILKYLYPPYLSNTLPCTYDK